MTNDFVISWDENGLDGIIDITGKRQKHTFAILSGGESPDVPGLTGMFLRARYNPQRNYEIYGLVCDEDIDEEVLRDMFADDPQFIVDMIREKGVKLYSNRVNKKPVIV